MLNSLWNNVETLRRLAAIAPYAFLALGFGVAAFGQYARSTLDSRVTELKAAAEILRKRTPPSVDIALEPGDGGERYVLVIDATKDIPFKARWLVATRDDKVISGVMLQDVEFHPGPDRRSWRYRVDIPRNEIRDEFIEVRVDWESLYSSEFGRPHELRGRQTRSYRFVNGAKRCYGTLSARDSAA